MQFINVLWSWIFTLTLTLIKLGMLSVHQFKVVCYQPFVHMIKAIEPLACYFEKFLYYSLIYHSAKFRLTFKTAKLNSKSIYLSTINLANRCQPRIVAILMKQSPTCNNWLSRYKCHTLFWIQSPRWIMTACRLEMSE